MKGKTRIAPTPSGYLHRGNLFSFALTWLFAKEADLDILLRIDDLDQARYRPEFAEDIFRSLEALGIDYQEGPDSLADLEKRWAQRHRLALYQEQLQILKEKGHLFACSCSRKQIAAVSPDGVYPATCFGKNIPFANSKTAWRWSRNHGEVSIKAWHQADQGAELPARMHYQVLKSKDGYPAYQLSSLVDDINFGITHIVRGADLWDSTVFQSLLAEDLALHPFTQISFHHHKLVQQRGQKLSKSKKAPAAEVYRQPKAIKSLCEDIAAYLNFPSRAENLSQLWADWQTFKS